MFYVIQDVKETGLIIAKNLSKIFYRAVGVDLSLKHLGKCKKMAPKCDVVVKKLTSSGLIYFSIIKSHFLSFYWAKTDRGHFFCTYPSVKKNLPYRSCYV